MVGQSTRPDSGMEVLVPAADFEAVLAAARAGDEHAFVVLFRSVQPMLLRYLRTVAGPAGGHRLRHLGQRGA